MVWTGLSAVMGSCGMSAMCLPRTSERAFGFPRISPSLNCTDPEETARSSASSPRMPMAVVDLPEPDSPMIVTVSPASMQKDTPSTARMTPLAVTSSICSSSTFSRFPTSHSRSVRTEFLEESPQARSGGPVAQTVAEQVHPDHHEDDDQARQGHQPP